MNIKLLRKVRAEILARPTQVNMDSWFDKMIPFEQEVGGCGTTGCIAGWACTVGLKYATIAKCRNDALFDPQDIAGELLDITYEQGRRLFYVQNWPSPFGFDYDSASTPQEAAKVVSDRIDHFIATDGRE